MPPATHDATLPACPFLPPADAVVTAAATRGLGADRGPLFYTTALVYAQSLWKQGLPARSLLLLNRAMGCDLRPGESVLRDWPIPYAAVAWILAHARPGHYLGNPRRHWQHLATRMVPPRKDLRSWRAWACWRISRAALPELPPDAHQIASEGICEPDTAEILRHLLLLGLPGEAELWASVVGDSTHA